jgi:hypothetical protein
LFTVTESLTKPGFKPNLFDFKTCEKQCLTMKSGSPGFSATVNAAKGPSVDYGDSIHIPTQEGSNMGGRELRMFN